MAFRLKMLARSACLKLTMCITGGGGASSCVKLKMSDPASVLHLCSLLSETKGIQTVSVVNTYLQEQTGSSLAFLVEVIGDTEEAVIRALGNTPLDREMRLPLAKCYLEVPARKRISVVTSALDLDSDLQDVLRDAFHLWPRHVLSVPVVDPATSSVALLACLVDYREREDTVNVCTQLVNECFLVCLGQVLSAFAYEEAKRLRMQAQHLLAIAKKLFAHLGDTDQLLREIVIHARKLMKAESCKIFLVDDEDRLVPSLSDPEMVDLLPPPPPPPPDVQKEEEDQQKKTTSTSTGIPKGKGIIGYVAQSGKLLNVRDPYVHERFDADVDVDHVVGDDGTRTRNLLCFPIYSKDVVVGVVAMRNKMGGYFFDVFDEETALAFGVYCGISVLHSRAFRAIQEATYRTKVCNELITYHMKVELEDVNRIVQCPKNHSPIRYTDFTFHPRSVPVKEMPCMVVEMMDDMGFLQQQKNSSSNNNNRPLSRIPLTAFILHVKKGHKDLPYHNWMHAFSMTHFAYLLLKRLSLVSQEYVSRLQALAVLVTCMCCHMDHQDRTEWQKKQMHPSRKGGRTCSPFRRQRLMQVVSILNRDNCNFLEALTADDVTCVLGWVQELICGGGVGTSEASSQLELVQELASACTPAYQKDDARHSALLCHLLVVCSDLSEHTKDWRLSKRVTRMRYEELAKHAAAMASTTTSSSTPHHQQHPDVDIPLAEIDFLENVVVPTFTLLVRLFPDTTAVLDAVLDNLRCWTRSVAPFAARRRSGQTSLEILSDRSFEKAVLDA